jgi:hypothetical protein
MTMPNPRLAALQRGSAEPLELVYAAAVKSNDATAIEQTAQAMMSNHRLSGEWFDVTPDLAVGAIAAASFRLKDPIVEISIGPLVRSSRGARIAWTPSG